MVLVGMFVCLFVCVCVCVCVCARPCETLRECLFAYIKCGMLSQMSETCKLNSNIAYSGKEKIGDDPMRWGFFR